MRMVTDAAKALIPAWPVVLSRCRRIVGFTSLTGTLTWASQCPRSSLTLGTKTV